MSILNLQFECANIHFRQGRKAVNDIIDDACKAALDKGITVLVSPASLESPKAEFTLKASEPSEGSSRSVLTFEDFTKVHNDLVAVLEK